MELHPEDVRYWTGWLRAGYYAAGFLILLTVGALLAARLWLVNPILRAVEPILRALERLH
jgi:hypothetical protein